MLTYPNRKTQYSQEVALSGVDIIFRIAAIGLITAILNMLLKKHDKEDIATYVNLAGLVLVLIMVIDMVTGLFDNIRNILNL